MKVKEKKALWFPRSLMIISIFLLIAFSVVNKFVGYGELMLVINAVMVFVLILTFFQPIVSGLFYVLSSSAILYGLYTIYSEKVIFILLDFNVILLTFWLILISGIFFILIDIFPHMFDNIEFSKW